MARELNITEATYYRWRNHYGDLKVEDAKKLKQLEKQDLALKKLLAEAELEYRSPAEVEAEYYAKNTPVSAPAIHGKQ